MAANESFGLVLVDTMSVASEIDLPALVDAHAATLFRVAHSLLRNPDEARDVVQDVFVKVLQQRSKLTSINDLRVWLVRIAWNMSLDRRRRIQPVQMDEAFAATLVAQTFATDQALHDVRRLQAVLHEIDRLPKAERQALLLSALRELDTPDVARIMRRSESGVRALLFRARARLRDRLSPKGYA